MRQTRELRRPRDSRRFREAMAEAQAAFPGVREDFIRSTVENAGHYTISRTTAFQWQREFPKLLEYARVEGSYINQLIIKDALRNTVDNLIAEHVANSWHDRDLNIAAERFFGRDFEDDPDAPSISDVAAAVLDREFAERQAEAAAWWDRRFPKGRALYRGVDSRERAILDSLQPGETYAFRPIVSTSTEYRTARTFPVYLHADAVVKFSNVPGRSVFEAEDRNPDLFREFAGHREVMLLGTANPWYFVRTEERGLGVTQYVFSRFDPRELEQQRSRPRGIPQENRAHEHFVPVRSSQPVVDLPLLDLKPPSIVFDREVKTPPFPVTVTLAGRSSDGRLVGRDGAAYVKLQADTFIEHAQVGDVIILQRAAAGRDIARVRAPELVLQL